MYTKYIFVIVHTLLGQPITSTFFSTADGVFNWSEISLEVCGIDVQIPLIRKDFSFLPFDVIGHFHTFPV